MNDKHVISAEQNSLLVDCRHLSLTLDEQQIFSDISFTLQRGEYVAFIGPSGCGKTTFLKCIAGILKPTEGFLQVYAQSIGFVFQHDALLPWLTLLDNVLLPVEISQRRTLSMRRRAEELLELVGLADHRHKFPRELSGGMKKRAELARALITSPELLILDEPFAALDILIRERLNLLVTHLHAQTGCSIILVTHFIEEGCFSAERILTMSPSPGRIVEEHHLGRLDTLPERFMISTEQRTYAVNTLKERLLASAESLLPLHVKISEDSPDAWCFALWSQKKRLYLLYFPFFIGVIYILAVSVKTFLGLPNIVLPHPHDIFFRFVQSLTQSSLWQHVGVTVFESLSGFVLALSISLPLAYFMARNKWLLRVVVPFFVILNTVPSVALAPFLVLWLGFGWLPIVCVSMVVIFFPLFMSQLTAFQQVEKNLGELLAFYRPPFGVRLWRFELPFALPGIFSGIKIAATLSVIGAVVGEFVAGTAGLGFLLLHAKALFDIELMYVALLWLALLGLSYFAFSHVFYVLVRRRRNDIT